MELEVRHHERSVGLDLSLSAYKGKAVILQNNTVWAKSVEMPPEAWYEMYVKPWYQELARVGMRVLSH